MSKFSPACPGGLYLQVVKIGKHFVIRCGTPDCEWGIPMPDLGELALKCCCSAFRKHCLETHGLDDSDCGVYAFLDLEKWTLTLMK
jgi:hypothetical protein